MNVYRCTFDHIGRSHSVAPQDFVAEDAQALADSLYNFVRHFLASSGVKVVVDLERGHGFIIVGGFRPAGSFTIEANPSP